MLLHAAANNNRATRGGTSSSIASEIGSGVRRHEKGERSSGNQIPPNGTS
jgi:hypothetical protein